jgi:enoyl-CoA hydratase
MLFTGAKIGAEEALRLGAVNRVVPRERLLEETLELAGEIAAMNPFGVALAKRAVNASMDAAGQQVALQHAYDVHWLGHSNALVASGNESEVMLDLEGMKAAAKGGGEE